MVLVSGHRSRFFRSDSEYGIDASDPSWIEEAAQMSDDDYDAFKHAYFFAASYQSPERSGYRYGVSEVKGTTCHL